MSTNYSISVGGSAAETNSLFSKRSPINDERLTSHKLTKSNLNKVAAHIISTVGGLVEVLEDGLSVGSVDQGEVFKVGAWLIEDYDFVADKVYFRTATLEERKRYNLR